MEPYEFKVIYWSKAVKSMVEEIPELGGHKEPVEKLQKLRKSPETKGTAFIAPAFAGRYYTRIGNRQFYAIYSIDRHNATVCIEQILTKTMKELLLFVLGEEG